ncbi:hypothetical protein ACH36K_16315 [Clostridium sp. MB05]
MLEANLRDIKKKGKTLRNLGMVTGTLKRKNGEICLISMIGHKLETHLLRNGLKSKIQLNFENNIINTRIERVQKDIIFHNVINIDLVEL